MLIPGILGTFRDLFGGNDAGSSDVSDQRVLGGYTSDLPAPMARPRVWHVAPADVLLHRQPVPWRDHRARDRRIVCPARPICDRLAGVAKRPDDATADADTRDLAQSLAASVAVTAVTFANYDALGFSIGAGLTFLLLGCAGALWRLVRAGIAAPG